MQVISYSKKIIYWYPGVTVWYEHFTHSLSLDANARNYKWRSELKDPPQLWATRPDMLLRDSAKILIHCHVLLKHKHAFLFIMSSLHRQLLSALSKFILQQV